MNVYLFPNDDNVVILSNSHINDSKLKNRPYNEVLFRKIHTYLIKHNIIDKNRNIIDLGAWIGDNTLPWSKMINGTVYAIDPSDLNCDYIKKLKILNNSHNIKIIEKAISNNENIVSTNENLEHCSFVYNNINNNCKIQLKSSYLDKLYENNEINNNDKIQLKSIYLDKLYENNEIENIGYIHLDVEGMEYLVLLGSENIINVDRPIVSYEIHLDIDEHIDNIKNFFINKNYIVYMINEILPGNRLDCRNFLAIPIELNQYIYNMESNFNKYNYILISHIGRCVYTSYDNILDAEYAYNILNNGLYATILYDVKFNTILYTYGIVEILNICKEYYNTHIKDNNLYNNILIKID